MSKRDDLTRSLGGNVAESMGQHGGQAIAGAVGTRSLPPHLQGVTRSKDAARIAVDRIVADPGQPRTEFDPDALERLANSLRSQGQLQAIRVRWAAEQGAYVVIVGERRWRAAQMAGLATLECIIEEREIPADDLLGLQLIENCLRDDLKPVEQARAYRRLLDARGWNMSRLAAELSLHQTTVSRSLALLDLPGAVQEQVERGSLQPSAAAEIAKLRSVADQVAVAEAVEVQGLARDEVAELVKAVRARRPAPKAKPDPVTVDLGPCTVQIRWKKADPISAIQALRRAIKALQDREQSEDQAA